MKLKRILKEIDEQQSQEQQPSTQMVDNQPGVQDKRQSIVYIEETAASFKQLYDRLKVIKNKIYSNTEMRESENYDKINTIIQEYENIFREFNEIALKSKSMA